MSDEDRNEFVEAVAAHQHSGGYSLELRSFMDGFWELIRRKDIFYAYTQSEVQKFVGGVSEVERFVIIYIFNFFRFGSDSLVLKSYFCRTDDDEAGKHIEWFWKINQSWPVEHRRALLRYITGLKRVPATDKFKVLKASDASFRRLTVLGNKERTVPEKDEDTPEHVLFIPEYDMYEALEENLLHVIYNSEPVMSFLYFSLTKSH
jgi:hypothetical protein